MRPPDPGVRRYITRSSLADKSKRVLLALLDRGVRMRKTKSGLVIYAEDGEGTAGTHLGPSDHRAHMNLVADLRRIGLTEKETP